MFFRRNKPHAIQDAKLTSLVGKGVEIQGDVAFTSGLRVDGRIVGQVVGRQADGQTAPLLVLSFNGHIEGSVRCGQAVVDGTIDGDLDVEDFLELQSNARVKGTIRYRQLRMDVGASVQGRMVSTEDAAKPAAVLELAAGTAPATV